jgi:hypothetical protein
VRWQSGNGANFSLFLAREAKAFCQKRLKLSFPASFSLVRFFLDEQKEMNINKKKRVYQKSIYLLEN